MKDVDRPSDRTEVTIKGLIIDPMSKMPVVILHSMERGQILPIWIGLCEANSIAMQLEGVTTPRPMTHDLLATMIREMGYNLSSITIHSLSDSVFFASLQLESASGGESKVVDSRPSDALALALRADARIFVATQVLDEASLKESTEEDTLRKLLEQLRPEDLGEYEM